MLSISTFLRSSPALMTALRELKMLIESFKDIVFVVVVKVKVWNEMSTLCVKCLYNISLTAVSTTSSFAEEESSLQMTATLLLTMIMMQLRHQSWS